MSASLNESLHVGPSLQNDIISILLRWREPQIGFSADIQMMYRQILVDPEDSNFRRIVWQKLGEQDPRHFRFLTLTYSTICAPYLAIRVLRQLAMDEESHYPGALPVLLRDSYIDDK